MIDVRTTQEAILRGITKYRRIKEQTQAAYARPMFEDMLKLMLVNTDPETLLTMAQREPEIINIVDKYYSKGG